MKFIGDFHIHSHYSLATSKELIPEFLDYWARIKGIKIIGTGDFTHPKWTAELKEKTIPAEQGLYKLKPELKKELPVKIPGCDDETRFMLTAEISNIYKKGGKVRKVHNLIFAPSFETVEKIQQTLQRQKFNITSDGRPILGLDSRNLFEMLLSIDENIFLVPAHIWTPWFSALGDKSGFDTIEECYEDLTKYIYAVEMGLSSHPPMNWAISFLDKYTLMANSDAHSPEKLGRNANIFDTEISYDHIIQALKPENQKTFLGTISFFPQEGKYHFDGHRKCNICWTPLETLKHNEICSVCNKKVTVGVLSRVAQLADREDILQRENRHPFLNLIPLKELLSEISGKGPNSKDVAKTYHHLLQKLGSEFNILMHIPVDEIQKSGNELLAEAIRRMRNGDVYIQEGFDGEFGVIRVSRPGEKIVLKKANLFKESDIENKKEQKLLSFDLKEYQRIRAIKKLNQKDNKTEEIEQKEKTGKYGLNPNQEKAVEHFNGPALIIAGPGTGKTRVLTFRIVHLINRQRVLPENILAITFTNKAASEIRERLKNLLYDNSAGNKVSVSTFHALGLTILKEHFSALNRTKNFILTDEAQKEEIMKSIAGCDKKIVSRILDEISLAKQKLFTANDIENKETAQYFLSYQEALTERDAFDLDDLVYATVNILRDFPDIAAKYRAKFKFLLVDEYQDTNYTQYIFIRKLMPASDSNLCVIGDPNQSIYGFRGANVEYIQRFTDDYSEAKVYSLNQSYRCSDKLLKASGNVINEGNSALTGIKKGIKIKIVQQSSEKSEAEFIARTIEKMIGGLRFYSIDSNVSEGEEATDISSLSDFAVLCRTKDQFFAIQKAFQDHSIPCQVVGQTPFYKKEPIISVLNFMRLAANPKNEFLLKEISEKNGLKKDDYNWIKKELSGKTVEEVSLNIIDRFFKEEKKLKPDLFLQFAEWIKGNEHSLSDFIEFLNLGTEADSYIQKSESVALMTIHASKGLEFKCVFIAGCEEGLLPYSIYEKLKSDRDEEKRLLYVGMTRAEKYLYLTHAERRIIHHKEHRLQKSSFLNAIEKELIEQSKAEVKKKTDKNAGQMSLF